MIHLGDITKINGYEVPIVDCVIGGSPCQDLSVAGKRAGLAGERSGLFMEQIRLIKEMKEQDAERNRADGRADRPVRPRYMVWENVPGAFSSNKGKDFAAVLEETIRIAEPEAPDVPIPPKGWSNAGAIVGDGWSVAWRTHDAQYWGVPQRRKRVSLIADFGGKSAPEILFECQSLPGNLEPSGEERKGPSEGTQGSTSYAVRIRGGCDGGGKGALVQEEKSGTLGTGNDQTLFCIGLNTIDRPAVYDARGNGNGKTVCTITGDHQNRVTDYTALCIDQGAGKSQANVSVDRTPTLTCTHGGEPAVFAIGSYHSNAWKSDNPHSGVYKAETVKTLDALNCGYPACNQGGMAVVQGFDAYNQTLTGDKTMSLTAKSSDAHHVPCALSFNQLSQSAVYKQDDISVALTCCGGSYGGGSECLVSSFWNGEQVAATLTSNNANGAQRMPDKENFNCVLQKSVRTLTPLSQEIHDFVKENNSDVAHQQDLLQTSDGVSRTLAPGTHAAGSHLTKTIVRNEQGLSVRRLTPLECERLQGFPDGWTDIGEWIDSKGKKHDSSDSARYKALGNSIALPFWRFLCKRISAQYARRATMASLFDGIGGFPLVWEEWNGKGSAVWASEIEEFPIAVTKYHFKENNL